MSSGMNYQLYRNTTLGTTLIDSLDELIQQQAISHSLRQKVLEEVYQPTLRLSLFSDEKQTLMELFQIINKSKIKKNSSRLVIFHQNQREGV